MHTLVSGVPKNSFIFQHRVAQETILYRDEQLREAQAWITRLQEMDALQSTTNHYTLQAELRERTEQYHQLWIGCQRQVVYSGLQIHKLACALLCNFHADEWKIDFVFHTWPASSVWWLIC